MRAFLRVSEAFDAAATEEAYQRWESSEDTAAPLAEVLSWYGTFEAAVQAARRPPPTPRPAPGRSAPATRPSAGPDAAEPTTAPRSQRRRSTPPKPAAQTSTKNDGARPTIKERRQAAWGARWGEVVLQHAMEGLTHAQIAERIDQPLRRVQVHMAQQGISRRVRGTEPDEDAAPALRPLADLRREAWVKQWGPTVTRLAAEGLTQLEIAERIDQPHWRVQKFLAAGTSGPRAKRRHNVDRDSRIVEQWAAGQTLEQVGNEFGMTRERVRQIVARSGVQRRITPAAQRRAELFATFGASIEELAPRCSSVRELVERLPDCPQSVIAEYMAAHNLRCRGPRQPNKSYTDDNMLDGLRRAASELGPLTAKTYQRWAKANGAARALTVSNRFGTWRTALQRAGVASAAAPARSYTNVWTSQRCIEAVRQWASSAPKLTTAAYEQARADGAELPSRGTLTRFVGTWLQTLRCVEIWQDIIDSGAMTPSDVDLSPNVWRSREAHTDTEATTALADVTRFVAHCRAIGEHPGFTRYKQWATQNEAVPGATVLAVYGRRWNVALTAAGHTDLRSSPNPRSTPPGNDSSVVQGPQRDVSDVSGPVAPSGAPPTPGEPTADPAAASSAQQGHSR